MSESYGNRPIWKTQIPIDYIDTSLTINNFENVSADLSSGKPCRLIYVYFEQTNNGATNEDIELEITINGTAYTHTQTAVSGTIYYCYVTGDQTSSDFTPAETTTQQMYLQQEADQAMPFTAETVGLVRVRQTTSVDGTSAQIEVNMIHEILTEV